MLPRLTERGIRLVAISPQKPDGSLTMQQKHDLAFTVVRTEPEQVIEALDQAIRRLKSARASASHRPVSTVFCQAGRRLTER
ncbi:MAG: hypothetical protein ABSA93_21290 [Streptosporangiaceae bacterium]